MSDARRVCVTAAILAALSWSGARADDAVRDEERAVQSWGSSRADCGEWSDGCVICRRGADEPACSLPGIACTAGPTVCRKPAATPDTKR